MKNLKYIIIVIFASAIFSSCEKEYESYITETPAPQMELIGDNPVVLFKGSEYVEHGIHAIEIANGDTTDLTYEVLNEVNVDITGTYKLQYKVTNSEGFDFYINRKVNIVSFTGYDVFELPEGDYDGIRIGRNTGDIVTITKLAPGVYQISDLLGGYYNGAYAPAPAILVISEDGSVRSELGVSNDIGPVVIDNFTFDDTNNVITYNQTLVWYDFGFGVQLTYK